MNPVALSIGPVALRWYGILIVGGTVLAAVVANMEAKRRGEDPDQEGLATGKVPSPDPPYVGLYKLYCL